MEEREVTIASNEMQWWYIRVSNELFYCAIRTCCIFLPYTRVALRASKYSTQAATACTVTHPSNCVSHYLHITFSILVEFVTVVTSLEKGYDSFSPSHTCACCIGGSSVGLVARCLK